MYETDESIGIKGGEGWLPKHKIIGWSKNSECCSGYSSKQEDQQHLHQMLVWTSSGLSYGLYNINSRSTLCAHLPD